MSPVLALFRLMSILMVLGHVVGASASSAPAPGRATAATPHDLSLAHFEQAIEQDLLQRWRDRVSRVEVTVLAPREPIRIPAGRLSLDVQPVPTVVRPGRILFLVTVHIDDVLVRKQKVAAVVKAFADLVLTTHGIPRGKTLDPSDLDRGEWRVRAIEHGLVESPDEAVGKRLLVTLPRGKPIPRPALRDPAHETTAGEPGEPAEAEREPPSSHPPGSGGGFRVQ